MMKKSITMLVALCVVGFIGLVVYSLNSLEPTFHDEPVAKNQTHNIVLSDSIYFEHKVDYRGENETRNVLQRVVDEEKSSIPSTAVFRFKSLDTNGFSFQYHERAKSLGWEERFDAIPSFYHTATSGENFQELIQGNVDKNVAPIIPKKGIITMITPSYEVDIDFEYVVIAVRSS